MNLAFFTTLRAFMQENCKKDVQTECKIWIQKKSCNSNPGSLYICSLARHNDSNF
jgi:predicted DNA-binding protein (UPF0278 family)